MGKGNKVIWIPRKLHEEIDDKFAKKYFEHIVYDYDLVNYHHHFMKSVTLY